MPWWNPFKSQTDWRSEQPTLDQKFCQRCGRELEIYYPFQRFDPMTAERIDGTAHKRCPEHICRMHAW